MGTGLMSSHLLSHDPEMKAGVQRWGGWKHFMGALWLTNKSVIAEVGMIDEQFEYGYYEDKDFARRVEMAGFEIVKAGWCKHLGNATSGKLPNMNEFFLANKKRFEDKYG
jgi:GT2 family glycosyltransferase